MFHWPQLMRIIFLSFFSDRLFFLFLVYSSSRLLVNFVFGIFVSYFLVPRRSAFLKLRSAPERGIPVEGKLSGGLELVRSCKFFFVVNC